MRVAKGQRWHRRCSVRSVVSPEELRARTLAFAVAAQRFAKPLLYELETRNAAAQLIKASSAANYRAACVARSRAEWLAKIGVVREESDESVYWLIYIKAIEGAPGREADLASLTSEARELTKIFVATYKTGRG